MTTEELTDHAYVIAADLATCIGDEHEVESLLMEWLTDLEDDAALVMTWTLRTIFTDCLREVARDQVPPDGVVLRAEVAA